ncbi:MAG: hypothetical protein QOF51_183 [Chloroflexota bacterium]|jgi:hypothetical protein|nr:hypothetical protein [Chloroflexota bacterium]
MKPSLSSRLGLLPILAFLLAGLVPVLPASAQQDCAPVVTIDSPIANSNISGQFTFAGWSVDQNVSDGSGISGAQIVLDKTLDQGGVVLATANPRARPDVDAALGRTDSFGFTATVDLSTVPSGRHLFYIYVTTNCGPAYATIAANVQPPFFSIDSPAAGATISNGQQIDIAGWVDGSQVNATLDGPPGQGQAIGTAQVNRARPDVVTATGRTDLANSGYDIIWTASGLTPAGSNHTIYVSTTRSGQTVTASITIVAGSAPAGPSGVVKIQTPGTGATVSGSYTVSGYAVDCTTGQPATNVRIYAGGLNGTLLGNATTGQSTTNLASVCASGRTGSVTGGWTFTLNSQSLTTGSQTLTAAADVTGGTVSDSVAVTVSATSSINNLSNVYNGNCVNTTNSYGTNTNFYGTSVNCINNGYNTSCNPGFPTNNTGVNNVPCPGSTYCTQSPASYPSCTNSLYNNCSTANNFYGGCTNNCTSGSVYGGCATGSSACNPTFPTVNSSLPYGPCPGSQYCNQVNAAATYPSCNGNFYGSCTTTFYNTGCGSTQCNPSFPNAQTGYPVNQPCPGSQYCLYTPGQYASCSNNNFGCSQFGTFNNTCNTTIQPPANVQAGLLNGCRTIQVNWTGVASATNYAVYYGTTPGSLTTYGGTVTTTSTQVTVPTTGTWYFAVIATANGATSGQSTPSNGVLVSC